MHRFTRPYGIAVAYCERNKGAKLIVATLSRLTRDTQTPAPKVGTEGLGQLANVYAVPRLSSVACSSDKDMVYL